MKLIEQIEIKGFRSFGNRKIDKVVIDKLEDLNIFSGSNDSGKSNILRALNLFFNKHTDLDTFFNFESDFFRKNQYDINDVKEKVVTIKIHFHNKLNKGKNEKFNKIFLPERFWVSRKFMKNSEYSSYSQADGLISNFKLEKNKTYQDYIDESEEIKSTVKATLKKQLTQFIDSIQYHYVPAIKDKNYFSHIYGELQQTLWKEEKSNVLNTKEDFEEAIQTTTKKLMEDFKNMTNYSDDFSPAFELPENLINIFKSLDVNTGNVKLTLRGDGIQAKLIPEILNFIVKKELSFKRRSLRGGQKAKKYFIWGFEEPENSYEYKNAQLLAERFKNNFSTDVQILITTHSFNFISLEGRNIATFRVYKDTNIKATNIQHIKKDTDGKFIFDNDEKSILHDDLGIFHLNKQLEEIYNEVSRKKELIEASKLKFEASVKESTKPLIVTEGKTDWKHIKHALEKFKLEGLYKELDINFFEYEDQVNMGDAQLDSMLESYKKMKQDKKIIFIFDRDNLKYTKKYAKHKFNNHRNNVYSFCIPKIDDTLDAICIEFYYQEKDLKTVDKEGRRLFIGTEFYDKSGHSKCGKFQLQDKNKTSKLTIIDSDVYSKDDFKWEKSIALSKNSFTTYILNQEEGYKNFKLDNFKLILDVIKEILEER